MYKKKFPIILLFTSILLLLITLVWFLFFYQPDVNDTEEGSQLPGFFDSKEDVSYLAIGNSLTIHPVMENIWWGEWGMAATSKEKDYVHLVDAYLDETYDVSTTAYNFADWETSESNRSDMFSELDQYLSPDLDLITIQLGENITTCLDTLNEDYTELVQYIKDECPNAQIMILDEFCWPKPEIQAAQKQAADTFSLTYIDLSEIRTDEYRAGLGTNVMGEDNEWHTITEATVAEHPNDDGMRYIANRIIANLSQL